jgi:hypothetical protein
VQTLALNRVRAHPVSRLVDAGSGRACDGELRSW